MISINRHLRRIQTVAAALGLLTAAIMPSFMGGVAYAFPTGAQVTSRSIKLSESKVGATNTSYDVKFTSGSTYTVKGIIVDFCAGSPIVGDATCTAPTGFSVGTPTVTLQQGLTATWAATSLNSGRTLKITKAAGDALTAASTIVEFTLTTATNPTTLGTFYARIITYDADATGDITTYSPGTEGSTQAIDYGGIALSTASQLTVTAKVQESLIFCVYTTGANCAGASGTAVPLGDANGVLSSYSTNYTNTAKFDIASNASSGVVVNLKGENLCRLATPCTNADTGNIISPSGTTCTADSAVTSVEQFGLRVSVLGSGVTATAPYNCASGNHTFDRANTIGTYGQQIAATTAPGDEVVSTVEFMAKAATTSEAGIYTTVLSMIATGTY